MHQPLQSRKNRHLNNAETSKREEIVAPLAGEGEVVKVFVREGEQVKAGQTIVRIVQHDRVRVVGEMKWAGHSPRELIAKVEIAPNDEDKIEFQGTVTFIDPQADANGNHRIWVEVENRQKDGKWLLVPGRMAKLTILRGDGG
jgi:multidrug resistance efflux pump